MKKIAGTILLAMMGLAAMVLPATADGPQIAGCSDIVNGFGFYDKTEMIVHFKVVTNTPSCPSVRYTLYLLDDQPTEEQPQQALVGWQTQKGNHTTELIYAIPVADSDSAVCIWGTTTKGHRLYDRAPDEGCVLLTDPPDAGGKSFG